MIRHLLETLTLAVALSMLVLFAAYPDQTSSAPLLLTAEVNHNNAGGFVVHSSIRYRIDNLSPSGSVYDQTTSAVIGQFTYQQFPNVMGEYVGVLAISENQPLPSNYRRNIVALVKSGNQSARLIGIAELWNGSISLSSTQTVWPLLAQFLSAPQQTSATQLESTYFKLLITPEGWYPGTSIDAAWKSTVNWILLEAQITAIELGSLALPCLQANNDYFYDNKVPQLREEAALRLENQWEHLGRPERRAVFRMLSNANANFAATAQTNRAIFDMIQSDGPEPLETEYHSALQAVLADPRISLVERDLLLRSYINSIGTISLSNGWDFRSKIAHLVPLLKMTLSERGRIDLFANDLRPLFDRAADQFLQDLGYDYWIVSDALTVAPQVFSNHKIEAIANKMVNDPNPIDYAWMTNYLGIAQSAALTPVQRTTLTDRAINFIQACPLGNISWLYQISQSYQSEKIFLQLDSPRRIAFVQAWLTMLNRYTPNSVDTGNFLQAIGPFLTIIKRSGEWINLEGEFQSLRLKLNPQVAGETVSNYQARLTKVSALWRQSGIFYFDISTASASNRLESLSQVENIMQTLYSEVSNSLQFVGLLNWGVTWNAIYAGSAGPYYSTFGSPQIVPHELAHALDSQTLLMHPDVRGVFGISDVFWAFGADRRKESFGENVFVPNASSYHSMLNSAEDFAMVAGYLFQDGPRLLTDAIARARSGNSALLSKALYVARFMGKTTPNSISLVKYDSVAKRYGVITAPASFDSLKRITRLTIAGATTDICYDSSEQASLGCRCSPGRAASIACTRPAERNAFLDSAAN